MAFRLHSKVIIYASFFAVFDLQARESITLYTYHQTPPFITGEKSGLTFDFADYLSEQHPDISIDVMTVPRKRLDQLIDTTSENIIVPWVSPVWFKKQKTHDFVWSAELMRDASVYIWNRNRALEFNKPKDLVGRRLGGIRGYRYVGVDPLVVDRSVARTNANNEKQLLKMLKQDRVDVGIIPFSSAQFLLLENQWGADFEITNHHQFTRYLMIRSDSSQVSTELLFTIEQMKQDPRWKEIIHRYGLASDPKALLID